MRYLILIYLLSISAPAFSQDTFENPLDAAKTSLSEDPNLIDRDDDIQAKVTFGPFEIDSHTLPPRKALVAPKNPSAASTH